MFKKILLNNYQRSVFKNKKAVLKIILLSIISLFSTITSAQTCSNLNFSLSSDTITEAGDITAFNTSIGCTGNPTFTWTITNSEGVVVGGNIGDNIGFGISIPGTYTITLSIPASGSNSAKSVSKTFTVLSYCDLPIEHIFTVTKTTDPDPFLLILMMLFVIQAC